MLASEHVRVRPDNEALFNAEIKKRPSLVSQTLLSRGVENLVTIRRLTAITRQPVVASLPRREP